MSFFNLFLLNDILKSVFHFKLPIRFFELTLNSKPLFSISPPLYCRLRAAALPAGKVIVMSISFVSL